MPAAHRSQLFNQRTQHKGNQKANKKGHNGIHDIAQKDVQQCDDDTNINKMNDKGSLFFGIHKDSSFLFVFLKHAEIGCHIHKKAHRKCGSGNQHEQG